MWQTPIQRTIFAYRTSPKMPPLFLLYTKVTIAEHSLWFTYICYSTNNHTYLLITWPSANQILYIYLYDWWNKSLILMHSVIFNDLSISLVLPHFENKPRKFDFFTRLFLARRHGWGGTFPTSSFLITYSIHKWRKACWILWREPLHRCHISNHGWDGSYILY